MKTNLKLIICMAAVLTLSVPASHAQAKIGVVDLRVLFEGYYKTKQADAKIKERAAELDKEREAMIEGIRQDEEAYRKASELANDLSVSADEATRRKEDAAKLLTKLQTKQQNIQAWERQAQGIIQEQQTRMRARVLEEIQLEISTIAKRDGFFLIIDKDARSVNQTPFIPYHNGQNDITDQVLSNLNAGAPAGLLSPQE